MVVLLGPTGREGPGLGDFALGAEPFPLSCLPFSAAKLRDLLSTTLLFCPAATSGLIRELLIGTPSILPSKEASPEQLPPL